MQNGTTRRTVLPGVILRVTGLERGRSRRRRWHRRWI
jgi:hypothetical protein